MEDLTKDVNNEQLEASPEATPEVIDKPTEEPGKPPVDNVQGNEPEWFKSRIAELANEKNEFKQKYEEILDKMAMLDTTKQTSDDGYQVESVYDELPYDKATNQVFYNGDWVDKRVYDLDKRVSNYENFAKQKEMELLEREFNSKAEVKYTELKSQILGNIPEDVAPEVDAMVAAFAGKILQDAIDNKVVMPDTQAARDYAIEVALAEAVKKASKLMNVSYEKQMTKNKDASEHTVPKNGGNPALAGNTRYSKLSPAERQQMIASMNS